jgi:hypothetical protein
MTPYQRMLLARRVSERDEHRQQFDTGDTGTDREPVGRPLTGQLDPTLRWGGSTPYNFLQQGPPLVPPNFPYFDSNLIAHATVPVPRTWSVLMNAQFDAGSEWAGSHLTAWTMIAELFIGVGQAQISMRQLWTGNPVDGFTGPGPSGGIGLLAPFADLVAFWPAVPGAEVNARWHFIGNQSGSPAPFTGLVSAVIAPYYPMEARFVREGAQFDTRPGSQPGGPYGQ